MVEYYEFLRGENAYFDKVILKNEETCYQGCLSFIKKVYLVGDAFKEEDFSSFYEFAKQLTNKAIYHESKINLLASFPYNNDYQAYHTVNVAVLSLELGKSIFSNSDELVNLAMFALCHILVWEDVKPINLRLGLSEDFLKSVFGIISVADVYETFTHTRPYRDKLAPYDVLKAMVSAADVVFMPSLARKALKVFSLYPLGSVVRLSNGEIAQVTKLNRKYPLRPEVLILTEPEAGNLDSLKIFDLSEHLEVYIKETKV